jgi:hypothetical protein
MRNAPFFGIAKGGRDGTYPQGGTCTGTERDVVLELDQHPCRKCQDDQAAQPAENNRCLNGPQPGGRASKTTEDGQCRHRPPEHVGPWPVDHARSLDRPHKSVTGANCVPGPAPRPEQRSAAKDGEQSRPRRVRQGGPRSRVGRTLAGKCRALRHGGPTQEPTSQPGSRHGGRARLAVRFGLFFIPDPDRRIRNRVEHPSVER